MYMHIESRNFPVSPLDVVYLVFEAGLLLKLKQSKLTGQYLRDLFVSASTELELQVHTITFSYLKYRF